MSSILVTGGAGFIGSHVCEKLITQDYKVYVLDCFSDNYDPAIKRQNAEFLQKQGCEVIEGDILDQAKVIEILKKDDFNSVLHLAARPGVRQSIENPKLFMKVNIEGTVSVLEACHETGINKIVFASSSSVYGNHPNVPFTETDFPDFPISPYAASKRAGEMICHTYHKIYDMNIWCLRFFTVYGPRQRPDMAIHKFTKIIDNGEEVPMFGDGLTERDYTYIDDIVQGVVNSIKFCNGYEIINLGESQTVLLKDLISTIGKTLGKEPNVKIFPMQDGDVFRTNADISKAKKLLEYNPTTDIKTGVQKFVDWYKSK